MSTPLSMDPARSRLRATVAVIDSEMSKLSAKPADGESSRAELTTAWADLVGQLALGDEPEVRACPKCGAVGMLAAKVCGSCWTTLTPPAHAE